MMLIASQPLLSPDGRHVLDLPELVLRPGDCWMVLGPNGVGKSTFLRWAAGHAKAPEHWRWCGQALPDWQQPAWAQQRAYLPQQHGLRAALTVDTVIRMGAFPWQGAHPALARERSAIVDAWELSGLLQRPWTGLSGGEQQRVQLARTALQIRLAARDKPRLWLLDEPLAALDLRHQAVALKAMRAEADAGALVVASVHDMNAALSIATHVLVLGEGGVLYQGEVVAEPVREALSKTFAVPLGWAEMKAGGAPRQWLLPLP